MLGQKLQKADELPCPKLRPQPLLQALAHLGKQRRQLPITEHVGMVQRRRPALQAAQIMLRVEHLLVLAVAARMRRDHLATEHDVDALHIALDRHRLEGGGARRAVAVVVEAGHLVLIDLGRLADARVEGVVGK